MAEKAEAERYTVVSIGEWHGRSSRFIADNLPEGGILYAVDTWIGSSGEPEMHASAHQDRGDHAHQWWWCNHQEHIAAGRVVPVRMHSENAAITFAHLIEKGDMPKFDLIFIDGDHSAEGIKTDVESWLPLLKDGGLICGHDYYPEGDGLAWVFVRQFVESKFPDVQKAATSIWYTYPKGERAPEPEPEPEHENLEYQRQSQYDFEANPEYAEVVEKAHRTLIERWFKDVPKDAKVLDAGCGNGVAIDILRGLGYTNLVGLDCAQPVIPMLNVQVGDLHAMPFDGKEFDVIYSVHSLEHAHDPIKVLSEFKRVLKPDGQLFLALPYPDYVDSEHRAKAHCGSPALGLLERDIAVTLRKVIDDAGFTLNSVRFGSLRNEDEVYLKCAVKKSESAPAERGHVYDCFIFNNEFDLLEMRLATLYDHVDRFVLVEGALTHSGQPKPFHFDENKKRFQKYLSKITHIVVDEYPEVPDLVGASELDNTANKAWTRERHQRDQILSGLTDCAPNDIILLGDADEIANPEAIKNYDVSQGLCRLKQRLFYYYLNCENKVGWDWQKIAPYKTVKELTPCGVRYPPAGHTPLIENGGWHFSFLGGPTAAIQKVNDYAHVEFNTPELMDLTRVTELIQKGEDIFGRNEKYEFVEIDGDYPEYVKEHQMKLGRKGFIHGAMQGFIHGELEGSTITIPKDAEIKVGAAVLKFKQPEPKHTVTASVSTKDRYHCLPLTLSAIINQTRTPDRLIIYDDGEMRIPAEELAEKSPFKGLLTLAQAKGIEFVILHTPRLGQVTNHQHCLDTAETTLIWRVDDDEIPEANCLEVLLSEMKEGIGAVGGLVHGPEKPSPLPYGVDGSLNDIGKGLNISWFDWNSGPVEVDHLYSTFLIRASAAKEAGGYPMELSTVGHREETIASHRIKRAGYKLLVTPYAKTYHLREASGGIRSFSDTSMWERDEQIFQNYLRTWGISLADTKLIVCDFGLGDHLILKGIWKDLKKQFPERKWTLALCFPETFKDEVDVTVISIADAKMLLGHKYDEHSVYRYAWDNNFVRPMADVMMEFFSK